MNVPHKTPPADLDVEVMKNPAHEDYQRAWVNFFFRCRPKIIATVQAILRAESDDQINMITDKVIETAFCRIDQYSGAGQFEGWIYSIARNLALSHIRNSKRRAAVFAAHADCFLPTSFGTPEADMNADETRRVVQEGLGQLSERHSQILGLSFFEDLSFQEMAEELGIPEGTVGSRLFRAKAAMRAAVATVLQSK